MKQKVLTLAIVICIVALLSIVVIGSKGNLVDGDDQLISSNKQSEQIVFYYGITCPHCKDVERWMDDTNVEDVLNIFRKEVYNNSQNANELRQAATSCGLSVDTIGVPFLFAQKRCIIGVQEIIQYLAQEADIASDY